MKKWEQRKKLPDKKMFGSDLSIKKTRKRKCIIILSNPVPQYPAIDSCQSQCINHENIKPPAVKFRRSDRRQIKGRKNNKHCIYNG